MTAHPGESAVAGKLPPQNQEAEVSVLGSVLLSEKALDGLALELRLRPEDFYRQRHRLIFGAMLRLPERSEPAPVDVLTICEDLDRHGKLEEAGGTAYVHSLPNLVPAAGNYLEYGKIVKDHAILRRLLDVTRRIQDDVYTHSGEPRQLLAAAEAALLRVDGDDPTSRTSSTQELAADLWDHLGDGDPETFAWPFERLDKLTFGGMRRGQVSLVAGWSSHGKSVFLDMVLAGVAREGARAHLFINEDTKRERTARIVSRMARVDFELVMRNKLDAEQTTRVHKALMELPFEMTDCTGWTVQDVARQIRRGRYDVVGVDVFNRFPFSGRDKREQIEEASRVLNEVVKPAHADCHLLLAVHLNRNRIGKDLVLPPPSPADIRESAMLYNDADNCLFVHREQDHDTAEPLRDGVIRLAKARNGRPGGVPVRLVGEYMDFEPRIQLAPGSVGALA